MKTIKPKDIKTAWHLFDAKNKVLGRISTEIARILMGKNKTYYLPYLDTGDHVVVVNAAQVVLSGKKESQKKYYRHSGYPGGLYIKTAAQLKETRPDQLLRHAVHGMLPKTKLGKTMMKKLHVFTSSEHPFGDKIKES